MTLRSERSQGKFRWSAYLTTGLALGGLVAAVLLLDAHPLLQAARGQLWGLNSLHYAEFDRKLPARQATNWYVGVGPGEIQPEAEPPTLSPSGGLFTGPTHVAIGSKRGQSVRCTRDGSIPTQHHPANAGPVVLHKTTVMRCRSFERAHQPSSTTTHTYLIDAQGSLPVLAVSVDPTNLWNKHTGIYARFRERGSEWERDAHVEYFSRTLSPTLAIDGRLRIHGFYSRTNPKKSLRLYYEPSPSDAHDPGNVLTWSTPAPERVVILGARELKVSRDELFQQIYSAGGGLAPANMPVFLYLNAEPWGIYYIRERVDEEFLQRRIGPGSYDLLDAQPGKPRVLSGDRKQWDYTVRFFETSDFTRDDTLAAAEQLVDLDDFTDYWLFNIYAANRDWPHHNMNMYRRRDGADGRWRWISWDADATFDFMSKGLTHDTLTWATRSQLRHDLRLNHEAGLRDNEGMLASTLIARKLLTNASYRQRFTARMTELLETQLRPERIMEELEALHDKLADDLEHDRTRWRLDKSEETLAAEYQQDLALVRSFIAERPEVVSRLFATLETGARKPREEERPPAPTPHADAAKPRPLGGANP